jgi:hypothetical protein
MDQVTTALLGPWQQLGLVGSIVIALGAALSWTVRMLLAANRDHLAEVKACSAQVQDLTLKKIESDNKLAVALEGLERVVETALGALKR